MSIVEILCQGNFDVKAENDEAIVSAGPLQGKQAK